MRQDQSGIGGVGQSPAPAATIMQGGASVGPFSTSDHFSSTSGPDVVNARSFVLDFELASWTSRQDIVGFNDASSGWFFNVSNSTGAIFHRGTGGSNYNFSSEVHLGRHRLVWRYTAAGALRASYDGNTVAQLSASPAYTAGSGTARFAIGKNVGESLGPCTGIDVHHFAIIDAELTDQQMLDVAGGIHGIGRNILPDLVTQHPNLHTLFRGLDWAGGAASWAASAGSTIYTLTRQGAGTLTKNAIPVYQRYDVRDKWLDNVLTGTESSPEVHNVQSAWSSVEYQANSSTCLVEVVETQASSFVNQIDIGGKVDGTTVTTQRGNTGSGIEIFPLNRRVIRDFPKQTAANHTWKLFSGLQSKGGSGPLVGIFPQAIWLPAGSPPTFTAYSPPAKRVAVWADSIYGQLSDTSSLMHTGTDESWTRRLAEDLAATGWRMTCMCWGAQQFAQHITTSGGRAAIAAQQVLALDGTTQNVMYVNLGHNDKELGGGYTNKALLISDLTAWRTEFGNQASAASIAGLTTQWITPYWGSNDANKNGGGAGIDMTDVRDAITQVANAFGDPVADGLTFNTATTGFGDGTHPRVGNPGHQLLYTNARALACFS